MRIVRHVRAAAFAAFAVVAVQAAATAVADSYDFHRYATYVSHGTWRTHSTMTNSMSTWITWTLNFSERTCTEWKGDVSMGRAAGLFASTSSCETKSRRYSVGVAPRTSMAFIQRPVTYYEYWAVRRYNRAGTLLSTGYTHSIDRFTDYAFADFY